MKGIQILDCTLRDGGRIINCAFPDTETLGLLEGFSRANIDIVEIGFLRDIDDYQGNSTFFGKIEQAERLVQGSDRQYTLFIDYGMYDISKLPLCTGAITGIRFGFTKKDFLNKRDAVKREMLSIKEKGYQLFFQGVNTVGYTDQEMLELIALANEVTPNAFGIVDTYGSMYKEDIRRLFTLVDFNLNSNVAIDFHGHNNIQMAFALAQEAIDLCQGKRNLIIDATLDGMGKCAGNLNTELIVHYLNQKKNTDYEFDCLLDAIDEYISKYKEQEAWGYSIPSFMAGIYKSHPNNVIYLTNKFRISTKDIRKMLSLIDEPTRQRYDYDNIQRIYKEYFTDSQNDEKTIEELRQRLAGRKVLVIAPGNSINECRQSIIDYVEANKPIVISVNFEDALSEIIFYGNDRRYQKAESSVQNKDVVLTSNVKCRTGNERVVNYMKCIANSGNYFDNSTLMLLALLQRVQVEDIAVAGMDGFVKNGINYFDDSDLGRKCEDQFEMINRELEMHLAYYVKRNEGKIQVRFITPSRFEHVTNR